MRIAPRRAAAARAVEFVRPGMRIGLGTGSTARHFVELLGERVRGGLDIVAVPTSEATRRDAERLGIPLTSLDEIPELDLTVDGADEIGPDLSVIKGGGGALLREKIVAYASERMIVIADESKWVSALGHFPLPVDVVPFGLAATRRAVEAAAVAAESARRGRGARNVAHARLSRVASTTSPQRSMVRCSIGSSSQRSMATAMVPMIRQPPMMMSER